MLSSRTLYAIQVMGYLAQHTEEQPIKFHQVARDTGIPGHAVIQVIQGMHKRQLLKTSRGSKGGITLSKVPEAITLGEIVCAVEGPPAACPVSTGSATCRPASGCPIYLQWACAEQQIHSLLEYDDLKNFPVELFNSTPSKPAQAVIHSPIEDP